MGKTRRFREVTWTRIGQHAFPAETIRLDCVLLGFEVSSRSRAQWVIAIKRPLVRLRLRLNKGTRQKSHRLEPVVDEEVRQANEDTHVTTGHLFRSFAAQDTDLSLRPKISSTAVSSGGRHVQGNLSGCCAASGEEPEHAPENQGFDYAYYGLFNGAPDLWPDGYEMTAETPNSHRSQFLDFPGIEGYKEATGIDLSVSAYVARKGQERKAIEGLAGTPGPKRQEVFEEESITQILKYVKEKAKDPKPFFIYWATYCQQLQGVSSHFNDPHVDHLNAQASMMAAHSSYVTRLLDTLKEEKIAENTLVVWMSDNGPMYAFYPNSGYSWLRGGKGQVLEGGVRTPSMAWWPGMIEANQDPVDLLHITDLYTTAARLGGALDAIPEDRVVDGVDQLPLLLLGEGHGRRKKVFFYSGELLGALRHGDIKAHFQPGASGGLPKMEAYNVRRDPGEKHGQFYPYLWTVTPIMNDVKAHKRMIQKFPHRGTVEQPKSCEK
eukprot:s4383_g3.t1